MAMSDVPSTETKKEIKAYLDSQIATGEITLVFPDKRELFVYISLTSNPYWDYAYLPSREDTPGGFFNLAKVRTVDKVLGKISLNF